MKMKKVLENQGLFLAEKERFELSRRLYPTYTLSRGASSANLSTSPYFTDCRFSNLPYYYILFDCFCQYFFTLFLNFFCDILAQFRLFRA